MSQHGAIPKKKPVTEKQNVKVVVRTRPLSRQEVEANSKSVVKFLSLKDILAKDKRYQFDRVFKPESTQLDVYQHVVAPMIPDVMSGYNCTVFAYGQTGSGKTYTMTGNNCESITNWKEDHEAGIILRAANHIFEYVSPNNHDKSVKVSYLELYNEEIRDLLAKDDMPLSIFHDMKTSVTVQGLTEICVRDSEEISRQLQKGNIKRQTAPTLMNHQSSRSHTVFTITVTMKETGATAEDLIKTGKINFVDLAGSENIARSGCKDMRAVELANINKSLLTLGRVIHALADKSKRHVPYRDSKLTRILQDSLGGHTKTCMIATISPAFNAAEETLSTLEYACRARDIKNCPVVNEKLTQNEVIQNLFNNIRRLEIDLEACRNATGFYISKENYDTMTTELEQLRASKVTFDHQIQLKDKEIIELEGKISTTQKEFDDRMQMCVETEETLKKLEDNIEENKKIFKQERFLSQTYEQKATQLHKKVQELVNALETACDHTNILHKKLSNQYYINKVNQKKAQETVSKITDTLEEVCEERNQGKDVCDNLIKSCKDDLIDFKIDLQGAAANLKAILDDLNKGFVQEIPVKENIVPLLNNFVHVFKKRIADVKSKLYDFSKECRTNISQSLAIFSTFKETVDNLVRDVLEILEKEDADVYDRLERLEARLLARRNEDDMILEELSLLKSSFGSGISRKKFISNVNDLSVKTRTEFQNNTDRFNRTFEKLNAEKLPLDTLDEVVNETETLKEKLVSESERLHEINKTKMCEAVDSISRISVVHLTEVTSSVCDNYESFSKRLDYLFDDIDKDFNSFNQFANETKLLLHEEFLDSQVPVEHEGDTPARKSTMRRTTLGSLTPREILLEKFRQLPTDEEDKENQQGLANTSAYASDSFLTIPAKVPSSDNEGTNEN